MTNSGGQPHEMLDAYLDGQLTGASRAAFERAMMADPSLRAAVEQQRAIDASLGRMFAAPGAAAAAAAAVAADEPPKKLPVDYRRPGTRGPIQIPWPLAAAAVILFTVGMSWGVWRFLEGPPPPPAFVQRVTLDQQYRTEVSRGFQAAWKCETDEQFMSTFMKQFGEPLVMDDPPADAGVEMMGLSYNAIMSPSTTYVLAKVKGKDVIVFVDRAGCGTGEEQVLKQPEGLHVFSRPVGSLMLYEVTPHDQPALIALFRQPETVLPVGQRQQPTVN